MKPNRLKRWFKKGLARASAGTLGFILGDVPGAVVGWQAGARVYDMTNGDTVQGVGFGGRLDQPFMDIDNLPPNSTNMALGTPYRRTPRYSGSSLFRTPGSSYRRSGYSSLRRSRYSRFGRRTSRFRYRYSARKRTFRGRFRRSRYFKRRRTVKRKAFRRRRMIRKNLKPIVGRSKGFQIKHETYGAVNDDHCVYLKHSSYYLSSIAQAITAALVRKLFSKLGYSIGDYDTILSAVGVTAPDASSYRILFVWTDPNVATPPQQFAQTLVAGSTIESIAQDTTAGMPTEFFIKYMLNADGSEPLAIQLQLKDASGSDLFRTLTSINIQNEYIYMNISSILRMQNRSLAPGQSGGGQSTDVVDNQPLSGKIMTFKHGDPHLRWTTMTPWTTLGSDYKINGIHHDGLDLDGASTLPPKWKEPPNKDKFANCISSKKFVINVGQCMQTSLGWTMNGRMVNVMKKLRPQRGGYIITPTAPDRVYHVSGKSQLVVFEEYIRTDTANTITVGYEREYACSVWFQTKRPTSFSTDIQVDNSANNYPPPP